MPPELVLFVGLQGAGKSSFYRARFNELLFQAGVNFNDLPLWQRRGTGLYWERYERDGYNPKLDQKVVTTRRRIRVDQELPMGEEYAAFVGKLRRAGSAPATATTAHQHGSGDS